MTATLSTTSTSPRARRGITCASVVYDTASHDRAVADEADESQRAANYPFSRYYLRPLAGRLAVRLAPTSVRPWHLTCCGAIAGLVAAGMIATGTAPLWCCAALILLAWFFDRADGQLARVRHAATPLGAWLDGNVDELLDLAWHAALAIAVWQASGTAISFVLAASFIVGKYLFMFGLHTEESVTGDSQQSPLCASENGHNVSRLLRYVRASYHGPANADFRVHLLVAALVTDWLTAELAIVAIYYNFRWIARYALVARRLQGAGR